MTRNRNEEVNTEPTSQEETDNKEIPTRFVEREITLSLLNDKLNYLISKK